MKVTTIDEEKQVVNLYNIVEDRYEVIAFDTINALYNMIHKIPPYDTIDYKQHLKENN